MTRSAAPASGAVPPRMLLISASDYQSAVIKGVASMLAEFDEGGFFDRVLIAFPFARTTTSVNVSERVAVRDMGTDWLPFGSRRMARRAGAPLHLARAVADLVRSVRRDQIAIVRATDPCFSGAIGWLVAKIARRPFCVSIHADFDKRHAVGGASAGATLLGSRALARRVERFVLRRADMVMPIRVSLREYALRYGVLEDRIRVIPHGTDLDAFVRATGEGVRDELRIPAGKKIISFAGRLVRENYVDDVIALARRLVATRDDFVVVMAGGGLEETRLRALVESDAVLGRVVRLAGFVPRATVAGLRRISDVSLCLMGGFSLIEACAAASPVIAYDVEWHAELVSDNETGVLVKEHDLDTLEAEANRLLDDRALGQRLGAAARMQAVLSHDLQLTRAIKQQCYADVMRG